MKKTLKKSKKKMAKLTEKDSEELQVKEEDSAKIKIKKKKSAVKKVKEKVPGKSKDSDEINLTEKDSDELYEKLEKLQAALRMNQQLQSTYREEITKYKEMRDELIDQIKEIRKDALKEKESDTKKKMILYLFVTAGIIFLFTLIINIGNRGILRWLSNHFIEAWNGILSKASIQQKISILMANFDNFKKSLWISTLLFIINVGLIFSIIKNKIDYKIALPILISILLIDVWSIDKKYLKSVESPKQYFAPDDITRFLSSDNDIFRVFPLNYENRDRDGYFQYHGIQNVGGYGPNPPRRYQEFIGAGNSVIFSAPNFFIYPHILSMLNVKYIVAPILPEDLSRYNQNTREIIEQYRAFYSNFETVGRGERYLILKNTNYLPRASLISDYVVVKTEDEALNTVLSPTFKAGNLVILEENPNEQNLNNEGSVSVIKYTSNERIFKVSLKKREFFVIRENYHPHWKCYINGAKEKVYRANYVFYGVFVPEGENEVQFVYESKMFNIVSVFSFIGFLILITSVTLSFRHKTKFIK